MAKPRFLADVMLGSLARWLRILGYDTAYDNDIDDDEIVTLCRRQERIALTRDQRLVQRRDLRQLSILIQSDDLGSQLRQVLHSTGEMGREYRLLERCLECNVLLSEESRERVAGEVPDYVYRSQRHFKRCSRCSRLYWRGTHRRRIEDQLAQLLERV